MDKQEIASLRAKVESKYQAELRRLEDKRLAIEGWRAEKLMALDMLSGRKTAEEWLSASCNVRLSLPEEDTIGVTKTAHRIITAPINQAEEIRNAVFALQKNISNSSLIEWFSLNKPELSDIIRTRSIRAELWRLEKKGKLRIVGKEGNAHVYDVITPELGLPTEKTSSDEYPGDQN